MTSPIPSLLRCVVPVPPYLFRDTERDSSIVTPVASAQFVHQPVAGADASPGTMLAVLQAGTALDQVRDRFRGMEPTA